MWLAALLTAENRKPGAGGTTGIYPDLTRYSAMLFLAPKIEVKKVSDGFPLYLSRVYGLDFDADADCLQIGCGVDGNNIEFDSTHDF